MGPECAVLRGGWADRVCGVRCPTARDGSVRVWVRCGFGMVVTTIGRGDRRIAQALEPGELRHDVVPGVPAVCTARGRALCHRHELIRSQEKGPLSMFRLAVGFVIGYVAGSKAGRERYEQIARLSSKAVDHPAVQGAAGAMQAKVLGLLPRNRKQQEPAVPNYMEDEVIVVAPPAPSTIAAANTAV